MDSTDEFIDWLTARLNQKNKKLQDARNDDRFDHLAILKTERTECEVILNNYLRLFKAKVGECLHEWRTNGDFTEKDELPLKCLKCGEEKLVYEPEKYGEPSKDPLHYVNLKKLLLNEEKPV